MANEEKNPLYSAPECKTIQEKVARVGFNLMCEGDDADRKVDIVLEGGEGCEKQVQVLSKYGVVAVCDETDEEVAAAADKIKAEREAQQQEEGCDRPLIIDDTELCEE